MQDQKTIQLYPKKIKTNKKNTTGKRREPDFCVFKPQTPTQRHIRAQKHSPTSKRTQQKYAETQQENKTTLVFHKTKQPQQKKTRGKKGKNDNNKPERFFNTA